VSCDFENLRFSDAPRAGPAAAADLVGLSRIIERFDVCFVPACQEFASKSTALDIEEAESATAPSKKRWALRDPP
jgi:hypothetical protein